MKVPRCSHGPLGATTLEICRNFQLRIAPLLQTKISKSQKRFTLAQLEPGVQPGNQPPMGLERREEGTGPLNRKQFGLFARPQGCGGQFAQKSTPQRTASTKITPSIKTELRSEGLHHALDIQRELDSLFCLQCENAVSQLLESFSHSPLFYCPPWNHMVVTLVFGVSRALSLAPVMVTACSAESGN